MELKDKAIKIQGKDYVLVSDRVLYFNDKYKNGSIKTEIIDLKDASVVVKATVTPDASHENRVFTGYSQEVNDGKNFINKTSMLENAETSAVGRALAMMGIGVIDSIASVDEINKATNRTQTVEEEKPRFNEKEYNAFKAGIAGGKVDADSYEKALKLIGKKYKVGTPMKEKLKDLYANSQK